MLLITYIKKGHRSKPPFGGLEVNPQLMRSETKRRRKNEHKRVNKK